MLTNFCIFVSLLLFKAKLKHYFKISVMDDLNLVNNEFLRQFEVQLDDQLARIEYSEQERKIFLTKISIPESIQNKKFEEAFIVKVLEFIENKNLRVVPTSPKIAGFVRRNRRYKELLPVGIKL
jgi:predicted GNAT family acetyltransferase